MIKLKETKIYILFTLSIVYLLLSIINIIFTSSLLNKRKMNDFGYYNTNMVINATFQKIKYHNLLSIEL